MGMRVAGSICSPDHFFSGDAVNMAAPWCCNTYAESTTNRLWRSMLFMMQEPITARFDFQRETTLPEKFDGIDPVVEPKMLAFEPALEWRRRWSAQWWHLAKFALNHSEFQDIPHIALEDNIFGTAGDLQRSRHTASFACRFLCG